MVLVKVTQQTRFNPVPSYPKKKLRECRKLGCRIAWNYVKTWFPLDVVVVGIDWWFQTQQSNGAEGEGFLGFVWGKRWWKNA